MIMAKEREKRREIHIRNLTQGKVQHTGKPLAVCCISAERCVQVGQVHIRYKNASNLQKQTLIEP
jgi:hypothetical protein